MSLRKSTILFWTLVIATGAALLFAFGVGDAFAQIDPGESAGQVAGQAGLQDTDIRIVIGRIINVALGFLGIIAVIIVLYAGFLWMTAGGNPEKVSKAKKWLINGVIGLVIIWTAYGITSFVINALLDATGAGGTDTDITTDPGDGLGGSDSDVFAVTAYSPDEYTPIRNVVLKITFSDILEDDEEIQVIDDSLIQITDVTDGEPGTLVAGTYELTGNKVRFTPDEPCPSPNEDRFCFRENGSFTVTVSDAIIDNDGQTLNCEAEATCNGSFATGEVVDVEDPTADITFPESGDRLEPGVPTLIQVSATDDYAVSTGDFYVEDTFIDSVIAEGDDLSDVTIETTWDTLGWEEDQSYTIEVTVEDLAGNTDTDTQRVRINPAHCYNGVQDEDETDIDCGGSCGACAGDVCVETEDCADDMQCIDGICVEYPTILEVSPIPFSAAPGSFVTISGTGFGNSEGTILMTDETGGTIEAEVASCSDGWSDTEIIIEVPVGVGDGPYSVETTGGVADWNDDAWGPTVEDFEVSAVDRPSLCNLSPNDGNVGREVRVLGVNFGDEQGESVVTFGTTDGVIYDLWSDDEVKVDVPTASAGEVDVYVTVDGVESNAISFEITEEETEDPTIQYTDPEDGGIGQYVTIYGSNFGSQIGSVWFESTSSGNIAQGSVDFPDECSDDFWSDDQITIIVPDEYSVPVGEPMEITTHDLYIETQGGDVSNTVEFIVTTADPTPGICSITPDAGEEGDEIIVYGANFGSSQGDGTVSFYNEAVVADVDSWSDDEIVLDVPGSASTGPIDVQNDEGDDSNSVNFEIGGEGAEAGPEGEAEFVWTISTGIIPETPEVIFACEIDEETGLTTRISGAPNRIWTDDVCVNAIVNADFNVLMSAGSLSDGDSVLIRECADESCEDTTDVPGEVRVSDNGSYSTMQWRPDAGYNAGDFLTSTTYEVTITTGAQSQEGVQMERDESWSFTTGSSEVNCSVEQVVISPQTDTITEEGGTTEYNSLAATSDCQVLNSDDYTWTWGLQDSIASLDSCMEPDDSCREVTALIEGETIIEATEDDSQITGEGDLIIDYTDPYVVREYPSCNTACVNALVGADFNIPMDRSIESNGMVRLLKCDNELCTTFEGVEDSNATCVDDDEGDCTTVTLSFALGYADPSSFYKVIISGDATSESGVSLTRLNDGDDYSWIFGTKDDDTFCAVSRIDISPDVRTLSAIGEKQTYAVQAFGEPDDCSPAGQELDAYAYDWEWEDPIVDDPNISEWFKVSGDFHDGDPSNPKEGCTSSCLPSGTQAFYAVCGDSVIGTGEDCDDGNVTDGDGCSSECLAEGSNACAQACSISAAPCTQDADCGEGEGTCEITGSSCCGDGVRDYVPATGAYEECDDSNLVDGDGCSAQCINEGSTAIGSTCGNGDRAWTAEDGGEDCDDGNSSNGDGCSSQCVNEGSVTLSEAAQECGNGTIEAPYESCDDGNAEDGDGCSSSCVREGKNVAGAVCGDGVVTRVPAGGGIDQGGGEDCDTEEGCSTNCKWEGSSLWYDPPSMCSDGDAGPGEYPECEVGQSGDGKIDPAQRAEISTSAAAEVDPETRIATSTIRTTITEFGLTDEATLNLSCTAERDDECSNPVQYGVANNSCCMERPRIVRQYPYGNRGGSGHCRNVAIYAEFNQEMDLDSFEDNTFIRLTPSGTCPSEYTVAQVPPTGNWFVRLWQTIRNFFGQIVNAQSPGDCLLPFTLRQVYQESTERWRVYYDYEILLEPNSFYYKWWKGDSNRFDDVAEGMLSAFGVGMAYGGYGANFTTGTEICTLDAIEVNDTDEESPYLFSQINEQHEFQAATVSYTHGEPEEITPIPFVYDWEWNDWLVDDAAIVDIDSMSDDVAQISAVGGNGDANVVASVEITADSFGDDEGRVVSGDADVTAFLCENPWPGPDDFPFIDDASGTEDGIEEGSGWTNFSTYYCRDAGEEGVGDDLPTVSAVHAPVRATTGRAEVFKEYLFIINDDSGDAIGARVVSNEDYEDLNTWYASEGFAGSPSEVEIDGFEALRDGRTLYVSAANQANSLYSNVYVFSYNEGAGPDTQLIFDDLVSNLTFNTNLDDVNLCFDGLSYTDQECDSDLDCPGTNICGSDKDKLRRDNIRLTDITEISNVLSLYGTSNGLCSATTSQTCSSAGDCPAGETCERSVPTLSGGTFVTGMTSSVWNSWNDTLTAAIGAVPQDPLNQYVNCGESPYEEYSAENCVTTSGAYLCPEGSFTYHYRSVGPFAYQLAADLEYLDDDWVNDIDPDASDNFDIQIGGNTTTFPAGFTGISWCDGTTVYGASEFCGDGIVGPTEVCEVGEEGPAETCDIDELDDSDGDGDPANDEDGSIVGVCNDSCSAFVASDAAACVPPTCGNGVIEPGEECDDGSFNGNYGFCDATCSYDDAFYCGDGSVGGGEVCDCGVDSPSGLTYGGLSCSSFSVVNGDYKKNPDRTCAWDCSGPASHCGDNVVDTDEECDGEDDVWEGALCNGGGDDGFPCTTDDDCSGGGSCGVGGAYEACPEVTVCLQGSAGLIGHECGGDGDCGAGGVCSTFEVQTVRTRTCTEFDGTADSCTWEQNDWSGIDCVAAQSCGDGTVDPGEECDDGNEDDTDSCTNVCTNNICGDGYLYDGVEECDDGSENGIECVAAYDSICTYCTSACRTVSNSGAFCGNNVLDGDEFCDGSDRQYYWYRSAGGGHTDGTCDSDELGDQYNDGTYTWTCRNVGICNGGVDNGDMCISNGGCSSFNCVKPACADSCNSSCPFSYDSDALLLLSNATGATRSESVDLVSYDPEEAQGEVIEIGNSATMYFPACRVGSELVADVDWSNVIRPDVYLIFLVDKSGSMTSPIDGGSDERWEVASDVIEDAIERLFDELENDIHISIVTYTSEGGSCDGIQRQVESICADGFCEVGKESELLDLVSAPDNVLDANDGGCSTPTDLGIQEARQVLNGVTDDTNVRKITVLLTDGSPDDDPSSQARVYKNQGYELYTVALTDSQSLINDMNDLSSGNPDSETGIDYAYDGTTAEELEAVYESILDSIINATVKIITAADEFVTDEVGEGNGLQFPWPEGFECDGENETALPFQITFNGEGYINISNVTLDYCKP